jgi:hypothetical protein
LSAFCIKYHTKSSRLRRALPAARRYMMWGISGAFLSVPIMSVIKIFCQNMNNSTAQWLASALEGNGNSTFHSAVSLLATTTY